MLRLVSFAFAVTRVSAFLSSCWDILLSHSRAPPRDLFVVTSRAPSDAARPPVVQHKTITMIESTVETKTAPRSAPTPSTDAEGGEDEDEPPWLEA